MKSNNYIETVCPITGQSLQEEKWNFYTHFFGLILSLAGIAAIFFWFDLFSNPLSFISFSVYGFTLVALYGASSLYHSLNDEIIKLKLQKLDHICIYWLIAGTYTPFSLLALEAYGGWSLFGIEWTLAFLGTCLKLITDKFHKLAVGSYVLMGWLAIWNFPTLFAVVDQTVLFWLILGGIFYTSGVFFYLKKSWLYHHVIWHFFVMAGSFSHFVSISYLLV